MAELAAQLVHGILRALVDVDQDEARRSPPGTTRSTSSTTAPSTRCSTSCGPTRTTSTGAPAPVRRPLPGADRRPGTNIAEDVVFLATGEIEDLNPWRSAAGPWHDSRWLPAPTAQSSSSCATRTPATRGVDAPGRGTTAVAEGSSAGGPDRRLAESIDHKPDAIISSPKSAPSRRPGRLRGVPDATIEEQRLAGSLDVRTSARSSTTPATRADRCLSATTRTSASSLRTCPVCRPSR